VDMTVRRPAWWGYPERCSNGHEWGPALIVVSWSLWDCPPALAAQERAGGSPAGHLAVYRAVMPGCRSADRAPNPGKWADECLAILSGPSRPARYVHVMRERRPSRRVTGARTDSADQLHGR